MIEYSEKQRELLRLWQSGNLRRINLLEGSVRSGKTWITLVLWAFWVATMPEDAAYLMVAKTLTSLRRNCLDLLETLVGKKNFTYSIPKKEARLFGRLVYLEGVNDARAESKIRGMTLQGALCDELTLFTEDFFAMLLSRLSLPGAKLFGSTNPDNPGHWLMKNYIDRQDQLDMLVMKFLIDDNPALDGEYVRQLKREYVGVYYKRFILGRWVAADGAVYPIFGDRKESFLLDAPPAVQYTAIGVDFGGTGSAHTFTLTGFTPGMREVVVLDEYYHNNKEQVVLSPAQLDAAFVKFVRRAQSRYPVREAFCDSAEQTLIQGLRMACVKSGLAIDVRNARKGPINERIAFYNSLMAQGRFRVLRSCAHTIEALENAVYSSKSAVKDERLDDGTTNIDSLDSMEYSTESVQEDILYLGAGRAGA